MSSKFGVDTGGRGGRGKKRKLELQQARVARALAIERPTFLPQSKVYTALCDFEHQVDMVLAAKMAQVNEALKRVDRVTRTLRVYVFNTFSKERSAGVVKTGVNDGDGDGEKTDVEPASWTLHVHGRFLEPGEPGDVSGAPEGTSVGYTPRFGAFVDTLTVTGVGVSGVTGVTGVGVTEVGISGEEEKETATDNDDAIDCRYSRARSDPLAQAPDGFELKRVGNCDRRVVITIKINHGVELFKTHEALAKVLGLDYGSKPKIIRTLWRYVEAHKLHCLLDPASVVVDEALGGLLSIADETAGETAETKTARVSDCDKPGTSTPTGNETIPFETLARTVCFALLAPVPPVTIDHVVRTSGRKNPTAPDVYDVFVEVPTGGVEELPLTGDGANGGPGPAMFADANTGKRLNGKTPPTKNHAFVYHSCSGHGEDGEIEACDLRIEAGVRKIERHEQRRTFLLGFANAPTKFINHVVAAQAGDAAVHRADGSTKRKAERRSNMYKQPWVDEAAARYLSGGSRK